MKHGDLAAAYDLCTRQGIPAVFHGPWTVPDYGHVPPVGHRFTARPAAQRDAPTAEDSMPPAMQSMRRRFAQWV